MSDETPIYTELAAERFRAALDAECETIQIRPTSLWVRLVERLRA